MAIGIINQALSHNDPQKTLAALLLPSSGLEEVQPINGRRYHDVLTKARKCKAEVRKRPFICLFVCLFVCLLLI